MKYSKSHSKRFPRAFAGNSSRALTLAFTLVELLVVISIIAVLTALVMAGFQIAKRQTVQSAGLSNMRQVGVAFHLYAGEHDFQLPGRTTGQDTDKWPRVLGAYLKDTRVFAAPGDPENWINRAVDPLDNISNNTSFIMNGYNDMGAYTDPGVSIRVNLIEKPSQVILLGTPKVGTHHFYMDIVEGKNGNHIDVLNLTAYEDGSNYLFADGSARFIKEKDYSHKLWLVNPDFPLPENNPN